MQLLDLRAESCLHFQSDEVGLNFEVKSLKILTRVDKFRIFGIIEAFFIAH